VAARISMMKPQRRFDERSTPVRELPADPSVVSDMDGVIVDSEPLWVRARKELVREANGRWIPEAEAAMMGSVRTGGRRTCATTSPWT
jgi:hypothetical protein